MTSKLRTPKVCPVCGEDVPRTALACPDCGADHTSGWREDAETYDALDLPDEAFSYEEFVKQEFGSSRRPAIKRVWWITAILLIAAFIAIYFYAAHLVQHARGPLWPKLFAARTDPRCRKPSALHLQNWSKARTTTRQLRRKIH